MKFKSFGAVSGDFWADFTLFSTTFAESGFAAHREVELAQNFFCLKADGKGLILGFEIFEFGAFKPELWHFSFVQKNVNLPHFLPLLGKILVLKGFASLKEKIWMSTFKQSDKVSLF